MVADKMVWTKWYGQNGMDKMVWTKWYWTKWYGQNGTILYFVYMLTQLNSININFSNQKSQTNDNIIEECQRRQNGSGIDEKIILSMGAGLIDDFIRNISAVPFCPYHFVQYHFVHTILSVPFCPLPFCPRTAYRRL